MCHPLFHLTVFMELCEVADLLVNTFNVSDGTDDVPGYFYFT